MPYIPKIVSSKSYKTYSNAFTRIVDQIADRCKTEKYCIQLLRERLSEKCARDNPERLYGIWSIHCSCRTYFCGVLLAPAAIRPWPLMPFFQISLKNLSERKTLTIPFGIVTCTFFDNLSRKSCTFWASILIPYQSLDSWLLTHLLHLENVVNEETVKLFISIIDAQLFKTGRGNVRWGGFLLHTSPLFYLRV